MFVPSSELLSIFLISVISASCCYMTKFLTFVVCYMLGDKIGFKSFQEKSKDIQTYSSWMILCYAVVNHFHLSVLITPARLLLGFSLLILSGTLAITSLLPLPAFCIVTLVLTMFHSITSVCLPGLWVCLLAQLSLVGETVK